MRRAPAWSGTLVTSVGASGGSVQANDPCCYVRCNEAGVGVNYGGYLFGNPTI